MHTGFVYVLTVQIWCHGLLLEVNVERAFYGMWCEAVSDMGLFSILLGLLTGRKHLPLVFPRHP